MPATAKRKHKTLKAGPAHKDASAVDYFRAKLKFETTPHQLKRDLDSGTVALLDVRDPDSFQKERIPQATNVPLAELEQRLSSLSKDKTLVTYCWNITCAMAPKAALILAEKGFKVQELVGGLEEWKKKFPTESAN